MADKDVNPHLAKWAHLKDNLHCTLEIDRYGTHRWESPNGQRHRVDENGIQDGPACIYSDGLQCWFVNDKRHRLDGPAVIFPDGRQFWYLDDHEVTQEEWAVDPKVIAYHSQTQEGAEEWLKQM